MSFNESFNYLVRKGKLEKGNITEKFKTIHFSKKKFKKY